MANNNIFLDTGALFALAAKTDQYHEKAYSHLQSLLKKQTHFFTSNFVIHETAMMIARRISKDAAIKFLNNAYNGESFDILYVDQNTEDEAIKKFKKYKDQDFSIADCASFVLMKGNKIERAFTFDKHFKTMKFKVEP